MSRRVAVDRSGLLPPHEPWQSNLVVGLFVAYVVEVVLHHAGLPLYTLLAWHPFGAGFEAWQPLTRFLVQGAAPITAAWVVLSLLVLYFLLPAVVPLLGRRTAAQAVLAGAVGGTILPLAVDATGLLASPPALGWSELVLVLPVLLGLAAPDADMVAFVFPMKARALLWGVLVVALLFLLVAPSLATLEGVGVWLGVFGWWHGLGPGARRRTLRSQAKDIESELRRFQVIEGGKERPQGRQSPGDDWVH